MKDQTPSSTYIQFLSGIEFPWKHHSHVAINLTNSPIDPIHFFLFSIVSYSSVPYYYLFFSSYATTLQPIYTMQQNHHTQSIILTVEYI